MMRNGFELRAGARRGPHGGRWGSCSSLKVGRVLLAMSLASGFLGSSLDADDRAGTDYFDEPEQFADQNAQPMAAVSHDRQGGHVHFQAGHLAFETFGRQHSITPAEIFPFVRSHDDLFFGDARLFVTNTGELGGNVGLGYRLLSDWGEVYGASLWYDADDSTGELFHQLGLSLELLAGDWELRANGYVPVGDRTREFTSRLLNQRFQGMSLVYDHERRWGEALPGVDVEFGVLLPGQIAREGDVRVFGGWYYFVGDEADNINGVKARVQADLLAGLSSQVEFTTDDTFGTNVMLGVSWAYDEKFRRRNEVSPRRDRLTEFIRRNYNVIVSKQRELHPGVVAVNPATGGPLIVQHVYGSGSGSSTGPATGTVDAPFFTLAEAQAAGGDLVFVHAGSVLTESVVLHNGDRLIGEGGGYAVAVAGFGNVLLPRATAGTSRPMIQSTSGDSVVLASNTVFSGFIIDGAAGNGLVGTGVGNVLVSDVNVRDVLGSGILLQNSAGPVTFESLHVENAAGPALHVIGGDAAISFGGAIRNQSGYALLVQNTTGGSLDLTGTTIENDGGQGVFLDHANGDVAVDSVLVENAAAAGIDIRGGAGDFSFNRVSVAGAAGSGIHIEDATGTVSFTDASITASSGNAAVKIRNSPGSIVFGKLTVLSTGGPGLEVADSGRIAVGDGTISAVGGSAVVLRNTRMDIALTSVSSDGASYGLEIVDTPGTFLISGTDALGTGGTIKNAAVAGVYLKNAGTVGLQNLDLTDNAIGIDAATVEWLELSRTRVTDSTSYGLVARNTTALKIAHSLFEGNGASSDSSLRIVANALDDSSFALSNSTVISETGDAIRLTTETGGEGATLQFALANNVISTAAAGASGLRVTWNGAVAASISENEFNGAGDSSRGILVDLPSATAASSIAIRNSSFSFDGNNSTGIDVTAAAPADVTILGNAVGFAGSGGTGLAFTLAGGADVILSNNGIGNAAGGATGILFRSMTGESDVAIDDNIVNLVGSSALVDRGIVFSSITGTVRLSGTRDNRINFATEAFSAPAAAIDGQILVNGVRVP